MKLLLIATEYYAYNSVPLVKSIKPLTIIEAKWDKTEKGLNEPLFIKLDALSGHESNYDLHRLQSY